MRLSSGMYTCVVHDCLGFQFFFFLLWVCFMNLCVCRCFLSNHSFRARMDNVWHFKYRGNAVVRPTAKKHVAQEAGTSFTVELNTDVKLDDTGKIPRLNKSKERIVIKRLIRVFQLLMVVAAVNVPLYMMLLFKDWIEQ